MTKISRLIDKHPLNGRYGFTRDDVINQIRVQADLTGAEALGSQRRGAGKMMVKQETAMQLAMFTIAALDEADLLERIASLINESGYVDGAHHKDWVLGQIMTMIGEPHHFEGIAP